MISLWRVFWLEFTGLVRSKALALLLLAAAVWIFALERFVESDGTAEGARQLFLHYSLGGVFALLVISLVASATGSLASERTAHRLQLTLVRPVGRVALVLGKIAAHVGAGLIVLAAAATLITLRLDHPQVCYHVLKPVLMSEREEAERMYEPFIADPETPEEVKKARKSDILRILTQRAGDHYQTIQSGERAVWRFDGLEGRTNALVRLRFSTMFDARQDVIGAFVFGGAKGVISNQTQAVVTVPLKGQLSGGELVFANEGTASLMLRPRKDIDVLITADGFIANLVRSVAVLTALLALVTAFGVFLGAALSRPVALFTAIVMLIVGEIGPSVVAQYPDQLETDPKDRIGLMVTRLATRVTRPFAAESPLERLAGDECVEKDAVVSVVVMDLLLLPLLLSALSAFILSHRDQ